MAVKASIKLVPQKLVEIVFQIIGTSPLIQHRWDEKVLAGLRNTHDGIKVKAGRGEKRDREGEFRRAAYTCENGKFGVPTGAIKKCVLNAAHKDIGFERTLAKKAIKVIATDMANNLVEMECDDPIMREDVVRVGMGGTDLRYRPEFRNWSIVVTCHIDKETVTTEAVLNLFNRAGFGVGLQEWRPEKGGEYGCFEIDQLFPVQQRDLPELSLVKPTKKEAA
jgi:hypothetical protein